MFEAAKDQLLPEELLREAPAPETLSDLLEEIETWELSDCVWRGQSRAWAIHPGMARVAREMKQATIDGIRVFKETLSTERLASARDECLLAEARCQRYLPSGGSDLHDLAVLQHHGAATSCLDATANLNVALWFAVNDHPDEEGVVILLSKGTQLMVDEKGQSLTDLRSTGKLYSFRPPVSLTRALAQQSVLLFGQLTESSVCSLPTIEIEPGSLLRVTPALKRKVKTAFRYIWGMDEGTLFPDLGGFCAQYSSRRSFFSGEVGDRAAFKWEG